MVLYNIYTIYKKGQTWTWNTKRKNRLLVKSFNILGESDWGKHSVKFSDNSNDMKVKFIDDGTVAASIDLKKWLVYGPGSRPS